MWFSIKCVCLLLVCGWIGASEAGHARYGLENLARLFRPLPPPPPPLPHPRQYFYPQGGHITSIVPPYVHGFGSPVYAATKFVVTRNHALPPSHLHDPDLVRFFYHQAPQFLNFPSLYTIPHGPPQFFDYPGGFGSFEKFAGPTTVYKEQPAPAVVSDGGYGPPPEPAPVSVSSNEYGPPSSGGYPASVSVSGGYGAPSVGGYETSSSGGYGAPSIGGYAGPSIGAYDGVSNIGGYQSSSSGGYSPSSGGYDLSAGSGTGAGSGGYGGTPPPASSGGASENGDAESGLQPPTQGGNGDVGRGTNPDSFDQNPDRVPKFGGSGQETGPSGRASSDRQEDTRPRPTGAAAGTSAQFSNADAEADDENLDEPPEIGFRSLTGGNRQREGKNKGSKTALDGPEPTKDPFKSSPFLSQYIDTFQPDRKKPQSQRNEENIGPIQFRSAIADADFFDYEDIDTAAGGEKTNLRPQQQKPQQKQQKKSNEVKGANSKQSNKKKISNNPLQDQVIFDEVDDLRNGDRRANVKGGSSKEEFDQKPTVDYEVGTTGASETGDLDEGAVKPTSSSGGYSSTTTRGSSATTGEGFDEVKPTGVYDDNPNTSTVKNGNFGMKIKPTRPTPTTTTTSSSNHRAAGNSNSNRQKKAAHARSEPRSEKLRQEHQRSRH